MAGIIGTELLSEVQARCDDPENAAPDADWQAEARIAADFGLLVLLGSDRDRTVTRTPFGDAWVATVDFSAARAGGRPPIPGPGRYDVDFFPLTKRPTFPIFALTGPTVASIRQGGWNLERGFGQPDPNPVTQVEMRSILRDGTIVSVQTETGERWALPALRVSEPGSHRAITDQLLAAMATRSAPWQVRPLGQDDLRPDAHVDAGAESHIWDQDASGPGGSGWLSGQPAVGRVERSGVRCAAGGKMRRPVCRVCRVWRSAWLLHCRRHPVSALR